MSSALTRFRRTQSDVALLALTLLGACGTESTGKEASLDASAFAGVEPMSMPSSDAGPIAPEPCLVSASEPCASEVDASLAVPSVGDGLDASSSFPELGLDAGGGVANLDASVIEPSPEPEVDEVPEEPVTPAPNLRAAYRRLVRLQCELEQRCFPAGSLFFGSESVEVCTEPLEAVWEWESALPDTGITLESVDECSSALKQRDCAAAGLPEQPGSVCSYPGARQDGDACISHTQCSSGWCHAPSFTCGECAPYPTDGTPCAHPSECPDGMSCSNGACVTLGVPGDACDENSHCYSWVDCIDGVCRARDHAWGEACGSEVGETNCDTNGHGISCDFETQTCEGILLCSLPSSVCMEISLSYALPGEECLGIGCARGADCIDGVCRLSAADEPCDDVVGPPCEWPLICLDGTCRGVPDSSDCEGATASPDASDAGLDAGVDAGMDATSSDAATTSALFP